MNRTKAYQFFKEHRDTTYRLYAVDNYGENFNVTGLGLNLAILVLHLSSNFRFDINLLK